MPKAASHPLARRSCRTLGPSWRGSLYALRCGQGWRRCAPPTYVNSSFHCVLQMAAARGIRSRAVRPLAARSLSACRQGNKCAGLALHSSVRERGSAPRSRSPSPIQGTPGCPSFGGQRTAGQARNSEGRLPLESRALSRQGSAGHAIVSRARPSYTPCAPGSSG